MTSLAGSAMCSPSRAASAAALGTLGKNATWAQPAPTWAATALDAAVLRAQPKDALVFTMNTYPVNKLLRPLTMPSNMAQLRLGLGTDLSARAEFDSFGLSLEGTYGYADNFSIIGGLPDTYNFHQFSVYFGFERALAQDPTSTPMPAGSRSRSPGVSSSRRARSSTAASSTPC